MKKYLIFLLFCILIVAPVFCNGDIIAKLIPEEGVCFILGKPDIEVSKPTDIIDNTRVRTEDGAKAKVIYNDGSVIKLVGASEIKFKKSLIRMKRGNSRFSFKKQGKKFKVITPTMLIGVFGTTFSVSVPKNSESSVSLYEGSIEARALFGNKKSVVLKPGQMVSAGKTGLSMISPIQKKIFNYGGGSKNSGTGIKDASSEDDENDVINSIVNEDLEQDGNLKYSIWPVTDNKFFNAVYLPFRLLIDGYATLNGRKNVSSQNGKLKVSKLESGSYEFTVLISGTSYSFPVEMNEEQSGFCKEIKYHRLKLNLFIGKSLGNGKVSEIMNNLEMYVTCSGMRQKVTIASYQTLRKVCENAVHLYRAKDGKDSINMCFPSELTDTALIEFVYTGDVPVKNKKVKLVVESDTDEYDVRF